MRKKRCVHKLLLATLLAFSSSIAHGSGTKTIPVGTALPDFKMEAPSDAAERQYLGLMDSEPFTLSEISAKVIILDFTAAL